jgi:hypothetical protein
MKRPAYEWLVVFIFIFAWPAKAGDALRPFKTNTPPVIDGKLDDPVWQQAPKVTGFKTFVPDFGIEMADQTEVYYAYDREHLYFAFRCFDSQPDKIKTSVTRRDNVRPDDWVCINLDSFNDQQALYGFYINPAGIQGDSRFASGREDHGVDLIWYSAGSVDKEGYNIEVRIPFKSIRFANKDTVEMGVIFERRVSRRSEQGTYPPLKPERGFFFLTQMQPMILQDVRHYKLFELLPAVTFNQRNALDRGRLVSQGRDEDFSLTTKYGITSDLILDGTYNPDFSQVESDAGQVDVNLRFALFFPEKRPFFLEGSENFNFAGSAGDDPLPAIVHTRNILDPLAGVKLSGKLGKKNFVASLNAIDEVPAPLRKNPDDDKAYFSIFRYKRALSEDSYIGVVYTGRERQHGFNRVFGADGQLRINQSSIFGYHAFAAQSQNSNSSADDLDHALGLDYLHNTRNLNVSLGFQDLSSDFQTETGFVTRTGISRIRARVVPKIYPSIKFIRRIDPQFTSAQIRDKLSDLYETDNGLSLRFVFRRNASVNVGYNYATEIFDPDLSGELPAERFNTSGVRVSGSSQLTKQLSVSLSYRRGNAIFFSSDPFQGYGNNASANVTYQPSEKLNANFSATYSDFFRDTDAEKMYDITILRGRLTYQINKYLFFRGIVEHNDFRKRLLTDFLASFTYIPGTVLHFGYGSLYEKIKWENDGYVESNDFRETRRGFFAKASYLWRL